MSKSGDSGGTPRAIVHKRILDVAASNPDATLDDIAGEISAATPDLVERVLAEYGDPADQEESDPMTGNEQPPAERDEQSATDPQPESEAESERESESEPEPASAPDPSEGELTVKQRKTARVVHEHPDASQAKIADELGVTRATVSRRLNEIPGFEWAERAAFTEALFGERPEGGGEPETQSVPETETEREPERVTADALSEFEQRLSAVETAVADDRAAEPSDAGAVTLPPELAHKVVHASMESDRISEAEELQLLEALLR